MELCKIHNGEVRKWGLRFSSLGSSFPSYLMRLLGRECALRFLDSRPHSTGKKQTKKNSQLVKEHFCAWGSHSSAHQKAALSQGLCLQSQHTRGLKEELSGETLWATKKLKHHFLSLNVTKEKKKLTTGTLQSFEGRWLQIWNTTKAGQCGCPTSWKWKCRQLFPTFDEF